MIAKFNYVVYPIEESNDVTMMPIDELQGSILVHAQRMKGNQEEDKVLKVEISNRGTTKGRGLSNSRGGRGRGKQLSNKKSTECFKFDKMGHFQYECPSLEENMHYAQFDEEEILLMAKSKSHDMFKENVWYLDSGCSNHMCGVRDDFFFLL